MRRDSCSVLLMAGSRPLFIPRQYVVCVAGGQEGVGRGGAVPQNHLKYIDDVEPVVVRIAKHVAANVQNEGLQFRAAYSVRIKHI
jgi:hypothetical protein